MKVRLMRERTGDTGTFGRLETEKAEFHCLTAELPWRDNHNRLSCIKAGVYRAVVKPSQRFNRDLYHLENEFGREDVEIHVGNWAGDVEKGYRSDVKGCIALGFSFGQIKRPDGVLQDAIGQSVSAVECFMKATEEQPIELTIEWHTAVNPEVQNGTDSAAAPQDDDPAVA